MSDNNKQSAVSQLTPGYWWVENDGFDIDSGYTRKVHRIISVVQIPHRGTNYWAGRWVQTGTYFKRDGALIPVEDMQEWEGLRFEKVQPASFAVNGKLTDTEILDWIEANPVRSLTKTPQGYWRRLFGSKDASNRFATLREGVQAQVNADLRQDADSERGT